MPGPHQCGPLLDPPDHVHSLFPLRWRIRERTLHPSIAVEPDDSLLDSLGEGEMFTTMRTIRTAASTCKRNLNAEIGETIAEANEAGYGTEETVEALERGDREHQACARP